jgi:hypothetical protein
VILGLLLRGSAAAQNLPDLQTPTPVKPGEPIVIGFLGAFEKWDDDRRSVRIVANHLRQNSNWHVETFSHRKRGVARRFLIQALDADRSGKVEPEEAKQARIILYGQSMGGAATVKLAREMKKMGVPVLLNIQVDSFGRADSLIPSNVRFAANYYQREPLTVWGCKEIRPEDERRTVIIRNDRRHYPFWMPPMSDALWKGMLGGGHVKMEADLLLWAEVEMLIRAALSIRV